MLRAYLVSMLGLILPVVFAADTLVLNDGSKVDGTIIEEDAQKIVIKLKFGQTTYQRTEIREVQKHSAAPQGDPNELRDVITLTGGIEHRGLLVSEDAKAVVFDLIQSGKIVSKTLISRNVQKSLH